MAGLRGIGAVARPIPFPRLLCWGHAYLADCLCCSSRSADVEVMGSVKSEDGWAHFPILPIYSVVIYPNNVAPGQHQFHINSFRTEHVVCHSAQVSPFINYFVVPLLDLW